MKRLRRGSAVAAEPFFFAGKITRVGKAAAWAAKTVV
jgi:hypothetical protein